ncbi:MAG: response regulator [Oligoflexia bacterium]|nr:response regulator [Oligoflexia bacterium]
MKTEASRKTVLVVEDDHDTRVTLRRALEEAGHFVVSAGNGAAALTLLEQVSTPSVVVLDLNMPLMNGEQFLQIFRADAKFAAVPVIQMSAAHSPRLPGTCCAISKPFDIEKLLQAIERCE